MMSRTIMTVSVDDKTRTDIGRIADQYYGGNRSLALREMIKIANRAIERREQRRSMRNGKA